MLLLAGIFGLMVGVWFGRKWRYYKICKLNKINYQYKELIEEASRKMNQLTRVNKSLLNEVKLYRKNIRIKEIDEMKTGVIDAATELMVEV